MKAKKTGAFAHNVYSVRSLQQSTYSVVDTQQESLAERCCIAAMFVVFVVSVILLSGGV